MAQLGYVAAWVAARVQAGVYNGLPTSLWPPALDMTGLNSGFSSLDSNATGGQMVVLHTQLAMAYAGPSYSLMPGSQKQAGQVGGEPGEGSGCGAVGHAGCGSASCRAARSRRAR